MTLPDSEFMLTTIRQLVGKQIHKSIHQSQIALLEAHGIYYVAQLSEVVTSRAKLWPKKRTGY